MKKTIEENNQKEKKKNLPVFKEFYIAQQDRGKLIGFNGVNIKKIQETTGKNRSYFRIYFITVIVTEFLLKRG